MIMEYINEGVFVCSSDRTYYKVNLEGKQNLKGTVTIRVLNGRINTPHELTKTQRELMKVNSPRGQKEIPLMERVRRTAETGDWTGMFEEFEPAELIKAINSSTSVKNSIMNSNEIQEMIKNEIESRIKILRESGDGSAAGVIAGEDFEPPDDDADEDVNILAKELEEYPEEEVIAVRKSEISEVAVGSAMFEENKDESDDDAVIDRDGPAEKGNAGSGSTGSGKGSKNSIPPKAGSPGKTKSGTARK